MRVNRFPVVGRLLVTLWILALLGACLAGRGEELSKNEPVTVEKTTPESNRSLTDLLWITRNCRISQWVTGANL